MVGQKGSVRKPERKGATMSDLAGVAILAVFTGAGCAMVTTGRFMWAQQHRFFGLVLGMGGVAILSVAFYAMWH